MSEINLTCKNIYAFIRLRMGNQISDREIARRWPMEWKSFNGLKHGKRQVPRIVDLEGLARLLNLDAAFVFEVARGTSAELVHNLLHSRSLPQLSQLLLSNTLQDQHQNDGVATVSEDPMHNLSATAACMVLERGGMITAANGWGPDVAGVLATGDMVGKNAFYLFDDFGGAHCPVTRAFESGHPEQEVVRRHTSTGAERMIHRCVQPVLDDTGEVIRVIEVDVDLTEAFQHAAPDMIDAESSTYHRRDFSEAINTDSAQP